MSSKICQKCGEEYDSLKAACPKCGSSRTAPDFIKALRPITRFTSVSLQHGFEDPDENTIAISRWYPRAQPQRTYTSNRITLSSPEQWEAIRTAIDSDLALLAGWTTRAHVAKRVAEADSVEAALEEYRSALQQYPKELLELLSVFDPEQLAETDLALLPRAMELLSGKLSTAEEAHKESFFSLLDSIDVTDQQGIESLRALMCDWRLIEIARISDLILHRLSTIDRLEMLIHNEKVYEIAGDDSIHRFLERNLWVIDESYLLLRSNKSLRAFIGDEMLKASRRDSLKRPDFVCSEHGRRLIIIEIKAPSHQLTKDDLNQIEDYTEIIREYRDSSYTGIDGYLIGRKVPSKVRSRARGRSYVKGVLSYDELVKRARDRYQQYYDELEQLRADEAVE